LLWDANAAAAVAADVLPFYSGPSLDSPAVFAGDRYWWPGLRHNGGMNVGFVDGHVAATRRPLSEAWRWGFVPGS
jgi:prepilin-type processing-associated H-X9-DG protein